MSGSRFQVPGSGFRVPGSGVRVRLSGSGFRVSSFELSGDKPPNENPMSGSVYLVSPIWRARALFRFKVDGFAPHIQRVDLRIVSRTRLRISVGNVERFRGGLVFKAHRLFYLSTLGSRVIKKEKKKRVQGGKYPTRRGWTGRQPIRRILLISWFSRKSDDTRS